MFKAIKKSEASIRKIADNKTIINYITKDISAEVSLASTEATNYYEKETTNFNRIYFIFDGQMILTFDNQEIILGKEESCFIKKGTTYEMKGTFKAIIINQPAFST